jgi:hypothetical protein
MESDAMKSKRRVGILLVLILLLSRTVTEASQRIAMVSCGRFGRGTMLALLPAAGAPGVLTSAVSWAGAGSASNYHRSTHSGPAAFKAREHKAKHKATGLPCGACRRPRERVGVTPLACKALTRLEHWSCRVSLRMVAAARDLTGAYK